MKFLHFTSVSIPASGDIVSFQDKLPGKARKVISMIFSANAHHNTKALCNVGLTFNGGRNQEINQAIKEKDTGPQTKSHPILVFVSLEQNANVTGYIEDFGNASAYPYTVKVYYELID